MNHIISIKDNKPYDKFTNQLINSLTLNEIPIKQPTESITDILTILFNIHDKITTNNINELCSSLLDSEENKDRL